MEEKQRKKCSVSNCSRTAKRRWYTLKSGERAWYNTKLCSYHEDVRYNQIKNRLAKGIEKIKTLNAEKQSWRKNSCQICGWDKDSCDLHRIKSGKDGGKYKQENVLTLCPNCHRLAHRGKLVI